MPESHLMQGAYSGMDACFPQEVIDGIRRAFDSQLCFFDHAVAEWQMYVAVAASSAVLILIYVLLNTFGRRRKKG